MGGRSEKSRYIYERVKNNGKVKAIWLEVKFFFKEVIIDTTWAFDDMCERISAIIRQ